MMNDKQQAQLIILIILLCGLFFVMGLKIGLSECPEPELQVIQEGMIQVDSVTWQKVEIRRTNVKRYYEVQEK